MVESWGESQSLYKEDSGRRKTRGELERRYMKDRKFINWDVRRSMKWEGKQGNIKDTQHIGDILRPSSPPEKVGTPLPNNLT